MRRFPVISAIAVCCAGWLCASPLVTPSADSMPRIKAYLNMPADASLPFPPTLSQVGAFENISTLRPVRGLVAYDVNLPFWSDGAMKNRWIGLPEGAHIQFSVEDPWK